MKIVDLKNKKVFLTGASRGIGLAVAKKLHSEGAILCLAASRKESFESVENFFDKSRTFFVYGDLSKPQIPEMIVEQAVNLMGGLDIVINNAGLAFSKPMEDTKVSDWDSLMKINARAPFLICQKSIEYLKKSDVASIINISSVVGAKGYENQSVYSASKHALMGFTKAMAKEVQKYGIRVYAICPGGVSTEMVLGTRPDLDASVLIKPEQIADIIWYILTRRDNGVIEEINIRRDANIPFK